MISGLERTLVPHYPCYSDDSVDEAARPASTLCDGSMVRSCEEVQATRPWGKYRKVNLEIKEGTVKKWYVKEGDTVTEFQKIADIDSDKQHTELTSTDTGKIHKIYHPEDSVCQVGELLLEIELPDGKAAPAESNKSTQPPSKSVEQPTQRAQGADLGGTHAGIEATPAVRSLLRENKLDIKDVKGTGKNGRILKEDVLNFMEGKKTTSKKQ